MPISQTKDTQLFDALAIATYYDRDLKKILATSPAAKDLAKRLVETIQAHTRVSLVRDACKEALE